MNVEISSSEPTKCPRCNDSMEDGFIPDLTAGGYAHAYWYPGKPEPGWLTGIWVEKEKKRFFHEMSGTES